jgi:hypothetical protein
VPAIRRLPTAARRKISQAAVRPLLSPDYTPVSFATKDWDTLVLLDACRYDLFEAENPFDAPVEAVYSNASHTREFLRKNFTEAHLDTVYVTASPQLAGYEGRFAQLVHVWQDHWDEEDRTVRPESVTDAALEVAERYPDKRLIVHYMQPHYPFIGRTGQSLTTHATFTGGQRRQEFASVWELLAAGKVTPEIVRQAYRENLLVVLPEVERLVGALTGKTVVSSDHGNLFGKRVTRLPFRIYGHPEGIHDPDLTRIPWVELPYEDRRTITRADRSGSESTDETANKTEERLRDLGYLQ